MLLPFAHTAWGQFVLDLPYLSIAPSATLTPSHIHTAFPSQQLQGHTVGAMLPGESLTLGANLLGFLGSVTLETLKSTNELKVRNF